MYHQPSRKQNFHSRGYAPSDILPGLPHKPYRDTTDWNDTTEDEALTSGKSGFFVYSAAKALAEKAAWEFAKEHPEISLTTGKHTATFIRSLWNWGVSSLLSMHYWPIRSGSRHPAWGRRRIEHQCHATQHPRSR